jgi:predicted GNAT family acetyltransferase
MALDIDKITVINNADENRFEVLSGDHLAIIDYFRKGNAIVFTHTGVPDQLSGQGLASKMARTALDFARSEGLEVYPRCPFVNAYIRRHPEYQDLVSDRFSS